MLLNMFHGKIHRATVTEACLEYMGSITIDSELLELSGIMPGERVQIVDNNNGSRLETYAIEGERGSGVICLNGAAARLVAPKDVIIIASFVNMSNKTALKHEPKLVFVDGKGRLGFLMEGAGRNPARPVAFELHIAAHNVNNIKALFYRANCVPGLHGSHACVLSKIHNGHAVAATVARRRSQRTSRPALRIMMMP